MLISIKMKGEEWGREGGIETIDNKWECRDSIQRVWVQLLGGRIGKWEEAGTSKHGEASKGNSL